MKNANVPDDKATPKYHHLEPRIAAMKDNTIDNRAAPRTILYSCCGPCKEVGRQTILEVELKGPLSLYNAWCPVCCKPISERAFPGVPADCNPRLTQASVHC